MYVPSHIRLYPFTNLIQLQVTVTPLRVVCLSLPHTVNRVHFFFIRDSSNNERIRIPGKGAHLDKFRIEDVNYGTAATVPEAARAGIMACRWYGGTGWVADRVELVPRT